MPNRNAPAPARYNGWYRDELNSVLEWYHNGTKIGQASGATVTQSGELRVANGFNIRIGTVGAFGSTEPTDALVMFAGTAPAGAITTAGGVFSSSTVVRKIIADGTVSNVET